MNTQTEEFKHFLLTKGIVTNCLTYNLKRNGQVDYYNGIIWGFILMIEKNYNSDISQREEVLAEDLYPITSAMY